MSLSDAMKKLKYDKRLTENMLKYGDLTQQEVDQHLESLEDVQSNSETLSLFDLENGDDRHQQSH